MLQIWFDLICNCILLIKLGFVDPGDTLRNMSDRMIIL